MSPARALAHEGPRAAALASAVDLVMRYLRAFPAERARMGPLSEQLSEPDDIFCRSNMRGHITSSALVLNRHLSHVLLVHHIALDGWFPAGGHYYIGT